MSPPRDDDPAEIKGYRRVDEYYNGRPIEDVGEGSKLGVAISHPNFKFSIVTWILYKSDSYLKQLKVEEKNWAINRFHPCFVSIPARQSQPFGHSLGESAKLNLIRRERQHWKIGSSMEPICG